MGSIFIFLREEHLFLPYVEHFHRVHMLGCKLLDQKNAVSFNKQQLQKKKKRVQRLLFLSLHCFNVTTQDPPPNHPHPPTTQPPTSQLAKQICSCLSAQYESYTSSWLAISSKQRYQVNLVRMFWFNFKHSLFVWFEWTPREHRVLSACK